MQGQTNRTMMERHIPQTLRNTMTDSESRLWQRLRGRQLAGCKFRRQHPFFDYVLDFVCLERYLIVEVDGGQHLESGRDKIRDKRLQEAGFQILRFWNNEVLEDIDAVVEAIWVALNPVPASVLPLNPIPTPTLPLKGRENSLGLAGEGEQPRPCRGGRTASALKGRENSLGLAPALQGRENSHGREIVGAAIIA